MFVKLTMCLELINIYKEIIWKKSFWVKIFQWTIFFLKKNAIKYNWIIKWMTVLSQEQFRLLNNKIHDGWVKKKHLFLTKGFCI